MSLDHSTLLNSDGDIRNVVSSRWPSLAEVEAAALRQKPYIRETPILKWSGPEAANLLGLDTELWLKLELFQETGSFKVRGALNNALTLHSQARERGLVTVSSGNHAAAVSYSAGVIGTTATVVMPQSANPMRIRNCVRYGGKVVKAKDTHEAWEVLEQIVKAEDRTFVHPYEGALTSCGASTLGLELDRQLPELDAVIVAIGGGGLCSGMGLAYRVLRKSTAVLAVEPEGADTMFRSFKSGKCERLTKSRTIADSLAPPMTFPYSMALCKETVRDLRLVSDEDIRSAMRLLFSEFSLVVEPGGAAALAGALSVYRDQIAGKKVAVILCGSNIDLATFSTLCRA